MLYYDCTNYHCNVYCYNYLFVLYYDIIMNDLVLDYYELLKPPCATYMWGSGRLNIFPFFDLNITLLDYYVI